MNTDCCVVGAGPAGALLSLLLARQGLRVTLLEAHDDFDRDFRGDILQPAALDVLAQAGLIDQVLRLALARHAVFPLRAGSDMAPLLDVRRLRTPYPFLAMVPQARFLDLLVSEAARLSTFTCVMGARAEALVR